MNDGASCLGLPPAPPSDVPAPCPVRPDTSGPRYSVPTDSFISCVLRALTVNNHISYMFGSLQLFLLFLQHFIIVSVLLKLLLAAVEEHLAEVDKSCLVCGGDFQLRREYKKKWIKKTIVNSFAKMLSLLYNDAPILVLFLFTRMDLSPALIFVPQYPHDQEVFQTGGTKQVIAGTNNKSV